MSKHYTLAVHDLKGRKLCGLYDSNVPQIGDAHSIKITRESNGWKEVEFCISHYDSDGERNYRWDFLKNENKLYLTEDGVTDVYCLKEPEFTHDSGKIQTSVLCNHISEELKTKNLYKYFDDENGIGTCDVLIATAIAGSGWTLASCDTFMESDGVTEKVRSYSCETKTGAYKMISEICELFDARPVFNGLEQTIDIRAAIDSDGWMELNFGRNMSKISRALDSSSMVTRLYVEGEYGDYGYVGIDSVNPTGLPFILDFSYYKELGLFTDEDQAIVDKYLLDYKAVVDSISSTTASLLEKQARINELIGGYGYAYYPVVDGAISEDNRYIGNDMSLEDAEIKDGDTVAVIKSSCEYSYAEYSTALLAGAMGIMKFVPTITGLMAAFEDKIEAAEGTIETYLEKLNKFLTSEGYAEVTLAQLHAAYFTDDLSKVKDEDFDLSNVAEQYKLPTSLDYTVAIGESENMISETRTLLYANMMELIENVIGADADRVSLEALATQQDKIENDFCVAMGSMLRDGYWSDDNYVPEQEQSLYNDALEISQKMSRPIASYSLQVHDLSIDDRFADEAFKLSQTVRIYEKEMGINDCGYVSKIIEYPDNKTSNTIEVETDILNIGNKTFATVLERITEMAEQVRRNKDIYQRAVNITKDGYFNSEMLSGAIDVMKTRLLSTASNWKTDDKGNIFFESLDGQSAMLLCGNGFMCANTKTENGDWNWRTFGTGDGFTADMIVTGYLSADRIEANSIQVRHLSSEVGENLDISSNKSVRITAAEQITADAAKDINLSANETINIYSADQIKAEAVNNLDLSSNDTVRISSANQISVEAAKNLDLASNETIQIHSAGQIDIDAVNDLNMSANGSINQTVSNAVGAIQVGGRNLILDSDTLIVNASYNIARYTPSEYLVPGEIYTASICTTPANGVSNYGVFISAGYREAAYILMSGAEKQTASVTFVMPDYYPGRDPNVDGSEYARIYLYRFPNDGTVMDASTIHWIKIERGNKATDWTPAPEDLESDVGELGNRMTSAETLITQNAEEIKSKASIEEYNALTNRVSSAESVISQQAEEISARVTKTEYTTEYTALEGRVGTTEVKVVQAEETIAKTEEELKAEITTVDGKVDSAAEAAANATLWRAEIESSDSDLVLDVGESTTLTVRVWYGATEYTSYIEASACTWKRESGDATADNAWNTTHVGVLSVNVTAGDVDYNAVYSCDVDIDDTLTDALLDANGVMLLDVGGGSPLCGVDGG